MKTTGADGLLRAFVSGLICGMIVLGGVSAFGQKWTGEQKEVWKAVEANWETFKKGDVEAALAMKHENAVVWFGDEPMPITKELLSSFYKNWFDYEKPTNTKLKPLNIVIFGNVANVFLLWKIDGEKIKGKSRVVETWVKEGNKWLLIGSLVANCDKLPPCPYIW